MALSHIYYLLSRVIWNCKHGKRQCYGIGHQIKSLKNVQQLSGWSFSQLNLQ